MNDKTEVAIINQKDLIIFDEERIGLIKRTIAPTATDDELEMFLHQCRRTGLDPLARQIYFQKYNTKDGPRVSIITGIDGYRIVADRTGTYAGSDEPAFDGRLKQKRYQDEKDVPAKAIVTVWKIVAGKRVPFTASAYWNEYYPGDKKGHMWFKMPHVMLAKVAEAQALRKTFPADLSGVYTKAEMDQANNNWEELSQKETIIEGETLPTVPGPNPDGELEEALAKENDHALGADHEDTRLETSPQEQVKREEHRPTGKAENGNEQELDHLTLALEAGNLKNFALNAFHAIDGYNDEFHVVGALTQKWPETHGQKVFRYTSSKTDEYLQWLADRKEAENG